MKKLILAFTLLSQTAFTQNYVGDFNGSTDYIDMGTSLATGVRSVCFWFKPNVTITPSTTMTSSFLVRDDNSNVDEVTYQIIGTDQGGGLEGRMLFAFRDNLSTAYYVQSLATTWLSTDWHYTCGTIDATAGMKLYVDANLEDINASYTAAWPATTDMLSMGRWGDENIRYYNGRIEEMSLWDRALSASEVSAKMCTPLNIATETGLIAYYKMNEGSGSVINNQLGGFTGICYGSGWVVDSTCVDFISVNEIENEANIISVYPNPTLETFSFQLPANERGNFSLVITDLAGKTIMQKNVVAFNGNAIITDVHGLASGTYLVKVYDQNLSFTGKFIKE